MKKLIISFILALLSVILLPTAAFGAFDYTVDKVDFTAELRKDGSVLITEEWTVTFSTEADGFSRKIIIPEDNFESFVSVSDVSVSVDGNGCNEVMGNNASNGTYSFSKTDNFYEIRWNEKSENETHVFSLRYVQNGAVKIYRDKAYFYCTAVNKDSGLVCRNVTMTVKSPDECFAEDFGIIESESLAGKKTDGSVVFAADNTADEVKAGITLPLSLFDVQKLAVITDDYTAVIIVSCISGVAVIAVCAYIIYYALHYRQLFRKKWEKKCRKKALDESSYVAQSEILKSISAAKMLNLVAEETVSGSDKFTVNLLELIKRGYITVTSDGFSVLKDSDCDDIGRPLDKNDKIVMKFFGSDNWQKTVSDPEKFYEMIEEYNEMLGFVNPFFAFDSKGKKLLSRCFELSLSAKRHEYVPPEEISDDFFKNGKFTVIDLIVSVLNEFALSAKKDFKKPDTSRFKRNMFMLRDIYEKGKDIAEQKELERLREKKRKKKKLVTDDDFDSQ